MSYSYPNSLCFPDDEIEDAALVCRRKRITRIVLADDDGNLAAEFVVFHELTGECPGAAGWSTAPTPLRKNCFATVPWHSENRAVWSIVCNRLRRHAHRECKMSMSTTYRAVEVARPGLLQLTQRPLKEPTAGQVRIRVEACGVCHSDSATVDEVGSEGALTGSPIDNEDTLGFSLLQGIKPMIETLPLEKAAEGYRKRMSNKARFRIVLTMGTPA